MFNWTCFLSRKATLQLKYIHTYARKQPLSLEEILTQYKNFNKSQNFCWMINNCGLTWTPRTKLGQSLINKLSSKIHMHGSASRSCLNGSRDNIIDHGSFALGSDYDRERRERIKPCKFYLSFENSNCTDYVTEKFGNPLRVFSIPIVNGFRDSYEQLVPGSFIHVKDFGNAENLARYLDYLLQNETAFMEYHKWRMHMSLDPLENTTYYQDQCKICRRIAQFHENDEKPVTIDDLSTHMKNLQTCDPKYDSYDWQNQFASLYFFSCYGIWFFKYFCGF